MWKLRNLLDTSDFRQSLLHPDRGLMRAGGIEASLNNWKEAQAGDRFFRIRCGMSNPADDGVIDSGYLINNPYIGEDWSGRGREVHHANMEFDVVIDYNHCPILAADKLDLRIPHFEWHGGHSGRLLDEQSAAELEALWEQHVHMLRSNDQTKEFVFSKQIIVD